MKHFFIVILLSVFCFSAFSQYKCRKAHIPPALDGRPLDYCWKTVEWAPIDVIWENNYQYENDFEGKYKVIWRGDKLYFLIRIMDDILYDFNPDPLTNYPADDGVEIFIDEDASGGEHTSSPNAWAYHLSIYGDVVDIGKDGAMLYNDHIDFLRYTKADTSYWECAVTIYPDTYDDYIDFNQTVQLWEGKKMGFAVAYNDNDYSTFRETMIGSHDINDPNYLHDKNINWITADNFDSLYLWPGPNRPPKMDVTGELAVNSNLQQQTVKLTGIFDGDSLGQQISITPYTLSAYISDILVDHDGFSDTALLYFNIPKGIMDTASILIKLKDNGGTEDFGIDTAFYRIKLHAQPLDIDEKTASKGFNILHSNGKVKIVINGAINPGERFMIFDLQGKVMASGNIRNKITYIPVESYSKGIYIIKIYNGGAAKSKPFIYF